MTLQSWVRLTRLSWNESNPTLHKDLKSRGELGAELKEAAKRAQAEMSELEDAGHSNQKAWDMTREKYLFLPAEPHKDQVASQGASLFNEANVLQSHILHSLNEMFIKPKQLYRHDRC